MVYPTNNQLLQDAYNLLCQSTNLEEVKSIVEGCGNCILSFQDQTTTRRRGRRRRRGGGNNGIDDNDDNDHNNNNNNNNTTALYKICSRSNRNKDDDLDIIKYILEQSVISNQNNEDGKGGLFTDHTTSRIRSRSTADSAGNGDSTGNAHSNGIRKNEINGTPLHQLVIQNRISILKHFANWTGIDDHSPRGSNDDDNNQNDKNHKNQNQNTRNKQRKRQTQKQIQKKKKSKQPKSQQKTRSRKPLLTPEDVVKYGLIFTAIQYQRFEMCQFLFHELYHPNMIQFTLDDTNKNMNMNHVNVNHVNVNTDIQNNSQQRQGALAAVRVGTGNQHKNQHENSHLIPLHYCTQLCYTTHYSFWERIFPYLLERGIKNDQYKYEYLDNRQYYKNATKSKNENEKGNIGPQYKHEHGHGHRHEHGQQQTSQELKKNRRQYNHKHKCKDKQMKCTSSRAKNKNNCQILDHSKMETSIGGLFIHDKKELYPNRNIFDIIVSQAKAQAVQTAQEAHQQTTTIANGNNSSGNSNSNGVISIEDAIEDIIRISYPLLENKSLLQGFIIHHCYQHQQQQQHQHHHQQHHLNDDATPYIQAIIKLCPKSINTPMHTCTSINDDENRQNQNNQQQQQQQQQQDQYQYSYLPIHIGAMYGLKWNHGMKDIVQANLTAIEEYDPIHGLFPFMLAAATDATIDTTKSISTNKTKVLFAGTDTSTKENNKSSTYSHCRCDLDTIYSLIRYRPDVYLKSKMIKKEQQSTNNESTHTCTKRKTKRNKRRRYRNKQNKKRKQKNKEQES